jgi:hypothetical protein
MHGVRFVRFRVPDVVLTSLDIIGRFDPTMRAFGDPARVLSEAREYLEASELPQEMLVDFCSKYFRRG